MSLSVACVFWFGILLAIAVVRGHDGTDDGTRCADDMSHVNTLRSELKSLMDAHWPSIAGSFVGFNEPQGDAISAMVARPAVGAASLRARLANGFYHRPSTVSHVTIRPMDAEASGRDEVTTVDDAVTVTVATIARPGPTVFGTEHECVAAASATRGDGHWLCVCYTTDYLDWVGQRLDEASGGAAPEALADGAFECPYFRAVTATLVVSPVDARPGDDDGQRTTTVAVDNDDRGSSTPVDFDRVANYRLERFANDHFAVHYQLVGSDVQVRCLENPGRNLIKWKYQKFEYETKSTIINTDSNELAIMGMDPADSKNYTCSSEISTTEKGKIVKNSDSYTHYIIAVEKPMYEIRGTMMYKANGIGNCTHEIIGLVRNHLPTLLRTEVCPEGSTRYACNVVVETGNCTENEKILVIEYSMTLNDKADIFTKIRTSKRGRNALYYQQILARISNVLASNLKKTLSTAQIVSKFTSEETHFEPDHEQIKMNTFVSCAPGFGLREVFCAACPPHHYSPDKLTECLKCPKNFHQPVAGSNKCVKCPTPFASGCYMDEVKTFNNYYVIGACLFLVLFFFSGCCFCCCREENKYKCLHSSVRRKFKLFKKKDLLPRFNSKKSIVTKGKKVGKSLMRFVRKPKQKLVKPVIPFEIIHGKMGPHHIKLING